MKFGKNVMKVNMHQLTESDFLICRHTFEMAAVTSASHCICSSVRQLPDKHVSTIPGPYALVLDYRREYGLTPKMKV